MTFPLNVCEHQTDNVCKLSKAFRHSTAIISTLGVSEAPLETKATVWKGLFK